MSRFTIGAALLLLGAACAPADQPDADAVAATGRTVDEAVTPTDDETASRTHDVNLMGCLVRESDYRAIVDDGQGGPLGAGLGVDDEYILLNAVSSSAVSDSGDLTPTRAASVYRAAVAAGPGHAYRIEGDSEPSMARDVGRLVEIVGMLGMPSQSSMPLDVDALAQLDVSLWHPIGDFCPGA